MRFYSSSDEIDIRVASRETKTTLVRFPMKCLIYDREKQRTNSAAKIDAILSRDHQFVSKIHFESPIVDGNRVNSSQRTSESNENNACSKYAY